MSYPSCGLQPANAPKRRPLVVHTRTTALRRLERNLGCARQRESLPLSIASGRTHVRERVRPMATTSARPAAAADRYARSAGDRPPPPVAALLPHGRLRLRPRDPDHRPRRGRLRLRRPRQPLPRRPQRALLLQRRPRPRRLRRGRRRPDPRARLLHELELRASARDRARRAGRRARAGRPEPRLLHQQRLGGGRVGDQGRSQLVPGPRQGLEDARSSPARSPTTAPRWER